MAQKKLGFAFLASDAERRIRPLLPREGVLECGEDFECVSLPLAQHRALIVALHAGNRDKGRLVMIDDPRKTEQLLSSLEAALLLESRVGPQLAAILKDKIPNLKPLQRCQISRVFYTGDEGGIVCSLELPEAGGDEVYLEIG